MSPHWFRRTTYWYMPCHIAGWFIMISAIIFCATVVIAANRHAHSVSDMLYAIYPYLVCTALATDRIAEQTCHD
ncbi:MAG: hypothetical protein ACKO83_08740 [Roseiflexaceae bacterium]